MARKAMNLTVIVPFWHGHAFTARLLDSLPAELPVLFVVDAGSAPPNLSSYADRDVRYLELPERGYFAGACNAGFVATTGDVLILNQDVWFYEPNWLDLLQHERDTYGIIGDGVMGHPAWPNGYVQGTFMFIRRDVLDNVGGFDGDRYPLWGCTCELQLRACRAGFQALPLQEPSWLGHERRKNFGASIQRALREEPERRREFIRTPPEVSVIMPCFNYGRYLKDAVASLLGGETCLGAVPGQTMPSFEIIIVNDGSTDETAAVGRELANGWHAVRYLEQDNSGMPAALNMGIRHSYGRYINVMSADDLATPERLEVLLATCEAHLGHYAYGNLHQISNTGAPLEDLVLPEYDWERLKIKNHISVDAMYPREMWEAVGGYPETMRFGREDWAFNLALGLHGYHAVHSGAFIGHYRDGGRHTRNCGQVWRTRFLNQLARLYPGLYAEIDIPEPLELTAREAAQINIGVAYADSELLNLYARPDSVILRYTGSSIGREPFVTSVGRTFKASVKKPLVRVPHRVVDELLRTGKFRVEEVQYGV